MKIYYQTLEKICRQYKNIRAISKEFFYESDHILYKLMTNPKLINTQDKENSLIITDISLKLPNEIIIICIS